MSRASFFVLALAFPWSAGAAGQAPPNVLLITVDTLRADHLSSYGYAWKTSPHMDQLASEGARFDRAYTVIPLTGPAHLSLFTGRYPQEHGARRNGEAMVSETPFPALPQVLRANGYVTAGFVSGWPLNGRLTHIDDWFDHYDEELTRRYQLVNSSRWAEDVTPRAIRWLQHSRPKDRPFFLWLHYFDPHSPYDFREHFAGLGRNGSRQPAEVKDAGMRERIRNYDTEIAYTDWYIGKLLAVIDELKLRDSTVVVLTAGHGESLGEHDYVGHGRHLYESILRVPLIVRAPGAARRGVAVTTPVSILDIAPTVLDLTIRSKLDRAKAPLPFAGRSLASAIGGKEPLRRRIYYLTFPGKKGFAPKWLSWLWVNNQELPLRFGYLEGKRKLVWSPEEGQLALSDLAGDPYESNRRILSEGHPYDTESRQLSQWFSRTETRAANQQVLSARDVEILKSLGYVQ
jgi:arylsulfatase A-like enzyme